MHMGIFILEAAFPVLDAMRCTPICIKKM